MNLRLEELLIWFLEFGQLYIVIYGIVGALVLIIIGLSFVKETKIYKVLMGFLPIMIMLIVGKSVLTRMDIPIPVNLDKLFFALPGFLPVLIMIGIGLTIWECLGNV